jgi:hypothetical protein
MSTLAMKYWAIISAFFLVFQTAKVKAQLYEFGLLGAATNYVGDIQPGFSMQGIQPGVGLWFKYNYNPYLGFKAGYFTTQIGAADANSSNQWQIDRNLSFSSHVSELFALVEFNFFRFVVGSYKYRHTPFVFTGLTNFRFNPVAEIGGNTYELQPFGTEGQGLDLYPDRQRYRLRTFSLPIGAGYRVNFWRFHSLAVEASFRYAFTDYLDDVSLGYAPNDVLAAERGNLAAQLADRSPEKGLPLNLPDKQRGINTFNDGYWYLGVSYIYTINSGRCPRF